MLQRNLFFAGPKDVKDIYDVLKDNAAQLTQGNDTINYQVHANPLHDMGAFMTFASFAAYYIYIFVLRDMINFFVADQF